MARIYSRKKGVSRSKKPMIPAKWVSFSADEVERLVLKFANDGLQSAKIGLILRDQYGIPSVKVITSKSIKKILLENNLLSKIPEDLFNLLKKVVNLRNHLAKNKKDYHSKRGLELLESKVRRLVKYYVNKKYLPADWKYDPERAKLIVEKGE